MGKNLNEVRGYLFIHGNPVYLKLDGRQVLIADSVAWWLEKVDDLIAWTESEAIFDQEEDRERTLEIFRRGRRYYERLLAKCKY